MFLSISADQVVENGPGLGQAQRSVLDDRRLSERMDGPQARRRKQGLGVAPVSDDFVAEAEFLQQPEDSLRTRIVEMMDLDQGGPGVA